MTREQFERASRTYCNLNVCDHILEKITHIENLDISELIVMCTLPSKTNYKLSLNICGIITSNELINFITDTVKKRKTELESELAKI